MNFRAFTLFLWGCLIASAALAGDKSKTEIVIAVDGDAAGTQVFRFDSDEAGASLDDLDVGESRIITDEDGNEVTMRRTEDGLVFNVGGETIALPALHGEHHLDMHIDGHDKDVVIDKHREVRVIKTDRVQDVTVISGNALGEATRERIRQAVKEGGNDSEVVFIDTTEFADVDAADGRREVRVIKKKIDVTN